MGQRPLGMGRGGRAAFRSGEAHRKGCVTPLPRRPGPAAMWPTAGRASPADDARRRAPDARRPVQGLAWAVALSAPFWAVLAVLILLLL